MNNLVKKLSRVWPGRPSVATTVASIFVLLGFLLAALDWRYLAISAVAMFLPGVLRELGWLKDKDEFELQAARRAGYHAYLAGGLFAFLMAIWFRSVGAEIEFKVAHIEDVLIVMWFTWLFSSLISYWGPARTAFRVLLVFGGVWLLFNIAAGEGDWRVSFMQSLLAVPFFLMAMMARRWPRVAGIMLLAIAVGFFQFFDLGDIFQGDPTHRGRVAVVVLFIGPLFASGVALLSARQQGEMA